MGQGELFEYGYEFGEEERNRNVHKAANQNFELRLISHLRGQNIPQEAGEGGSSSGRNKA